VIAEKQIGQMLGHYQLMTIVIAWLGEGIVLGRKDQKLHLASFGFDISAPGLDLICAAQAKGEWSGKPVRSGAGCSHR
jgi:hypothetical protein